MTSESTFGVVGQPFTSCTQVPEQPNTNLINVKCTQLILCNRENYVCWPDKQSHAEDVHGSERKDSKQDHQKRSVQRESIELFLFKLMIENLTQDFQVSSKTFTSTPTAVSSTTILIG